MPRHRSNHSIFFENWERTGGWSDPPCAEYFLADPSKKVYPPSPGDCTRVGGGLGACLPDGLSPKQHLCWIIPLPSPFFWKPHEAFESIHIPRPCVLALLHANLAPLKLAIGLKLQSCPPIFSYLVCFALGLPKFFTCEVGQGWPLSLPSIVA